MAEICRAATLGVACRSNKSTYVHQLSGNSCQLSVSFAGSRRCSGQPDSRHPHGVLRATISQRQITQLNWSIAYSWSSLSSFHALHVPGYVILLCICSRTSTAGGCGRPCSQSSLAWPYSRSTVGALMMRWLPLEMASRLLLSVSPSSVPLPSPLGALTPAFKAGIEECCMPHVLGSYLLTHTTTVLQSMQQQMCPAAM